MSANQCRSQRCNAGSGQVAKAGSPGHPHGSIFSPIAQTTTATIIALPIACAATIRAAEEAEAARAVGDTDRWWRARVSMLSWQRVLWDCGVRSMDWRRSHAASGGESYEQ